MNKGKMMSTSKVLIIIPAHNEEANIKRVIESCKSKCPYELNTPELLRKNLEDYRNFIKENK